MDFKSGKLTAVVLLAATFAVSSARAELVTNGSFEDPVINTGYVNQTPPSFPGWYVTTNNVDIVNPVDQWGAGATAYAGSQVLDLVGFGGTGGISQSLATTAGQTYSLTFAYSNNPGGSANPANALVALNGVTLVDVTHGGALTSNLIWQVSTETFTANTSSTILSFTENDGANGCCNGGILLDAVSVSAIPEPAT